MAEPRESSVAPYPPLSRTGVTVNAGGTHSTKRKWLYAGLSILVAASIVTTLVAYQFPLGRGKAGGAPYALIALGEIANDSSGMSAIYAITVATGNGIDLLVNYSFDALTPKGTSMALATVCVATSSGLVKGTWANGSWSNHGTSTVCSGSARFPPQSGVSISTGDVLYYYFSPSVNSGVPIGSGFEVSASGPFGGTVGELYDA